MERQLTFFEPPTSTTNSVSRDHLGILGLTYFESLLTRAEQQEALQKIDERPWLSDLSRRVQHYGFKYDYKARRIEVSMFVGPLPDFTLAIARRLVERQLISELPDQAIVNEYLPGQGITSHVDCEPCFRDNIVTISLGSVYEMEFTHVASSESRCLDLALGSALILSGDARYRWKHGIRARKADNGRQRERRVSLTFRNVILEPSVPVPAPG